MCSGLLSTTVLTSKAAEYAFTLRLVKKTKREGKRERVRGGERGR